MFNSQLHDEKTFYNAFLRDLEACRKEVIIESPFITTNRMGTLKPTFERLIRKGVKVFIITRDPKEHSNGYEIQSEEEIQYFEILGVQVLLCVGNHHRKLAILDRKVLWEGSLNILSQTHSREIMKDKDDFDRALVLSGDGDFLPILKYLREIKKEVIVLARGPRTAREIRQFASSNFRDFVRLENDIKFEDKKA